MFRYAVVNLRKKLCVTVPSVSGPGWAWTDADHLEFNGYVAEAIGADGDMVLTFTGQNSVI